MSGATHTGAGGTSGLPRLSIFGGRHELAVRGLTLRRDSFTIRYTITPPLPDSEASSVLLVFEAKDDLGQEHVDWGGAYGPGEDGTYTDGSVTGQPALAAGVRALRARITFLRDGEEFPYDVTLPVPLP
ncbi:hypothetical protein ABTY59_20470 [Streptomyces sp. NPDC096079]|uniref:hypothetical protein n=1 Tax=unclassified Streptomyces TaxID=2593676 RepID=UPI0033331D9F